MFVSLQRIKQPVFFADVSTLFTSSDGGVGAQLDVIGHYCDGIGAILKISRLNLLSLSRSSVGDLIIEFLENRFDGGFRQWYRRARTFCGRLLVTETMILSRLWHFTIHFNIAQNLLRRWQSKLNRIVPSRKYEQNSTHAQLIRSELLYIT
uniref:AlNc14C209G8873 protein n=1 Tax=Albugo laibachii Nc14 TaxID=890382 RepID=F0WR65_9STRA|nr:AlNc14C209G8873 [Albugo laibachii Nc14]|eukprot:CCA23826.1 AlNc14C209G8873 [Albugo laibachii Nc14]